MVANTYRPAFMYSDLFRASRGPYILLSRADANFTILVDRYYRKQKRTDSIRGLGREKEIEGLMSGEDTESCEGNVDERDNRPGVI